MFWCAAATDCPTPALSPSAFNVRLHRYTGRGITARRFLKYCSVWNRVPGSIQGLGFLKTFSFQIHLCSQFSAFLIHWVVDCKIRALHTAVFSSTACSGFLDFSCRLRLVYLLVVYGCLHVFAVFWDSLHWSIPSPSSGEGDIFSFILTCLFSSSGLQKSCPTSCDGTFSS